jgi:transcriptional regulator with XRE-family HTH domain
MGEPEVTHNLRTLRKQASLTQKELARRARVGLRTIYDIEAGRSSGRRDVRRKLLSALGVEQYKHPDVFGPLRG